MSSSLQAILTDLLCQPVQSMHRVSGGDICSAWRVEGRNGQQWFAKHHPREPPGMFALEAAGLEALRIAANGSLQVPTVSATTAPHAPSAWLLLDWIDPVPTTPTADAAFGHGLAVLHRHPPPPVAPENWLATVRQINHPVPTTISWPEFWWSRRLAPRLRALATPDLLPTALHTRLERLAERLPQLLAIEEPLSLIHGDLWSGNRLTDARGRPYLIDPAVSVGHREVDLAMMALFGGFGAQCWTAYDEAWPRLPGHETRRPIYQLYFLLVHVELFGASYWSDVARALDEVGG